MTAPDPTTAEARAALSEDERRSLQAAVLDAGVTLNGHQIIIINANLSTAVERILAARLAPASGLAAAVEALDDLAASHGHWCATQNSDRSGDYVCECGLPWAPGEGCAFVQGIRALLAADPAPEGDRAAGVNEGVWLAAQLVRDRVLTEQGQRIAEFLEDRAVMPAHVAARLAPASGQCSGSHAVGGRIEYCIEEAGHPTPHRCDFGHVWGDGDRGKGQERGL